MGVTSTTANLPLALYATVSTQESLRFGEVLSQQGGPAHSRSAYGPPTPLRPHEQDRLIREHQSPSGGCPDHKGEPYKNGCQESRVRLV